MLTSHRSRVTSHRSRVTEHDRASTGTRLLMNEKEVLQLSCNMCSITHFSVTLYNNFGCVESGSYYMRRKHATPCITMVVSGKHLPMLHGLLFGVITNRRSLGAD